MTTVTLFLASYPGERLDVIRDVPVLEAINACNLLQMLEQVSPCGTTFVVADQWGGLIECWPPTPEVHQHMADLIAKNTGSKH